MATRAAAQQAAPCRRDGADHRLDRCRVRPPARRATFRRSGQHRDRGRARIRRGPLAVEMRSLPVGESAPRDEARTIAEALSRHPAVRRLAELTTMHVGPAGTWSPLGSSTTTPLTPRRRPGDRVTWERTRQGFACHAGCTRVASASARTGRVTCHMLASAPSPSIVCESRRLHALALPALEDIALISAI